MAKTRTAASYRDGMLQIEGMPVQELAARFGTPLYVYSRRVLQEQYRDLEGSLQGLARNSVICYALKANANPILGGVVAEMGAGADVVSGGELYLARRMGFPAEKIVFAGVGKTRREMGEALDEGIRSFHVESAGELEALAKVAADRTKIAPIAIRVNPDVDPGTHPYITTGTHANKFGVSLEEARVLVHRADAIPSLRPVGLHCHIGSQLPSVKPIVEATKRMLELWDQLADDGIALRELDIGGGLGIPYRSEDEPEGPDALAAGLRPLLAGRHLDLLLEPGRFLVGPAGVLITTVLYVKDGFVIVDAGMNDLIRPALYGAYHPIYTLHEEDRDSGEPVNLAGPVCESSDVLGWERRLGDVKPGDTLAIGQAGAYGYSMASTYNGRPRPAEVLVDSSGAHLIRQRETYADLWGPEGEG